MRTEEGVQGGIHTYNTFHSIHACMKCPSVTQYHVQEYVQENMSRSWRDCCWRGGGDRQVDRQGGGGMPACMHRVDYQQMNFRKESHTLQHGHMRAHMHVYTCIYHTHTQSKGLSAHRTWENTTSALWCSGWEISTQAGVLHLIPSWWRCLRRVGRKYVPGGGLWGLIAWPQSPRFL